jgi:uncharacterized protein YqeY
VAEAPAALRTRLDEEIKDALRAGEKVRLGALRLLVAAITVREKELRRLLSDEEIREVAAREAKKRNEAIEAFASAGREELAARERQEREALGPYLPEQLSDAEVNAIVDEAIEATGATSQKEMGVVMGAVMANAKGKVDGSAVQRKVRARLGG